MYHFEIDDSDDGQTYLKRLEQLQELVKNREIGQAGSWSATSIVAICFDRHLYYPLFSIVDKNLPLKMHPIALDAASEIQFVKDLEAFYYSDSGKECIGKRSLYLLRNADTKSKGLGFASAGNFYPDFLLWLVDDETGKQWLSFVDPKGIRNIDLNDPKFGLYREVKILEAKLNDLNLTLNAFILSGTRFNDILNVHGTVTVEQLEERNVLFMEDGGPLYLQKMFGRIFEWERVGVS